MSIEKPESTKLLNIAKETHKGNVLVKIQIMLSFVIKINSESTYMTSKVLNISCSSEVGTYIFFVTFFLCLFVLIYVICFSAYRRNA